ncbi:MAG: ABC transporter substrate-binding protein [Clostridiaceae bacterium]|nr:ABC transporter substrate-binding protein [Clostridiaceae bacterium]
MKKTVRIVSSLLLVLSLVGVMFLTGCKDDRETLYVFNCGDYIDERVLDMFMKEYPHIRVVYDTFDTNEIMYQKLINSNEPYDVLIPSDYMIERLIKEDRLHKIDFSKLTNYDKIDDSFKGLAYDPEEEYSVTYMWGTLGILYNKKLVTEPVNSWSILWDSKYKGKILMLDSMRDTMGVALKKLGYSMNSTNPDEIKAAKDALIEQIDLVADYGVDKLKDMMIAGNYALMVAWSGDAVWMMNENPDLAYAVPDEGSNIWADAMVISKTGKNIEAAHLFIDFMCRTDIAKMNAEYIQYSTPQKEALSQLDASLRESEVYNPPKSVIERCESFIDLGDAVKYYNEAWEEVRLHG